MLPAEVSWGVWRIYAGGRKRGLKRQWVLGLTPFHLSVSAYTYAPVSAQFKPNAYLCATRRKAGGVFVFK
ncbi:MAG: hypothetical protein D6714_01875 [Bacteroidetes bacterium]|nr:MAG: hypothetical protein D6714_01875 [Bacteroidota bacterium]